jgi:hypothetical protein
VSDVDPGGQGVAGLREAMLGHVDRWRWTPGLDPARVGEALGVSLDAASMTQAGHRRLAASAQVDGLPWPVWVAWDEARELALIEVLEPPEAPRGAEVIAALGEPDARLDRDEGPYPGNEQLVYLSRGFTLFCWRDATPAALWLYRPTDLDGYITGFGATTSPTRPAR